jgi:hypothetical protein
MVRTQRYKLIYRTRRAAVDWYAPVERPRGRSIRLYDLQEDPEEFKDIGRDPAHAALLDGLLDRLLDWYRRRPPVGPQPPDGLSREEFLDWAIEPRGDVATRP